MAEYIDKNATVGILEAMSRNADCECVKKRLEKAAKRVGTMPAADAEEVVRCKDCYQSVVIGNVLHCAYWGKDTDENGYCHEGG
nr:MAG TPA: hypothetical protein [Caudoviricetes sp.]